MFGIADQKKHLSLPLVSGGRDRRNGGVLVRHIRGLGESDFLKSYFLPFWSEWNFFGYSDSDFAEMRVQIVGPRGN